MASHTTKSIRDLLKHVDSDELVLPEIGGGLDGKKRFKALQL